MEENIDEEMESDRTVGKMIGRYNKNDSMRMHRMDMEVSNLNLQPTMALYRLTLLYKSFIDILWYLYLTFSCYIMMFIK